MKSVYVVRDGADDFWYVATDAAKAKELHVNTQYESAEIQLSDKDKADMVVSRMRPHHYLTLDGVCKLASKWAQDSNGFIGTTAE